MITEDPQLEMRLRHYGSTVRQEARVSPELHARIIARVGHHAPARPYRMLVHGPGGPGRDGGRSQAPCR